MLLCVCLVVTYCVSLFGLLLFVPGCVLYLYAYVKSCLCACARCCVMLYGMCVLCVCNVCACAMFDICVWHVRDLLCEVASSVVCDWFVWL